MFVGAGVAYVTRPGSPDRDDIEGVPVASR